MFDCSAKVYKYQRPKQPKMDSDKNELFLLIILVKLAILCALKIIKIIHALYKKHNEIILERNFNDITKNNNQPKIITQLVQPGITNM